MRDQGLDLLSNPGFTGESGQAPVDLIRTLAVFAEAPSSEHIHLWQGLGIEDSPSASEYADFFLFQLYPYASVHLGPEGMLGGEAQNRVAGFWRALGKNPPPEPDHLAALLGLYATLSEQVRPEQKVSNELSGFSEAEAVLITQGRDALLQEHIAPWVPAYLERVIEIASGPYRGWAVLLDKVLQVELVRVGHPERLPLHLRESPPLA
ncbi:MAG: molecular chaperone TorD family protein, partial [Gemmatimonadetes bacterium]|nr:molecular chaperone TorD family protein [Gemmatimonadota bacterium]